MTGFHPLRERIVESTNGREYEICSDGKRLWINADDGSAVARFNINTGVDVHNTATDQMGGAPECLWCTHEKPDYDTWISFIEVIKCRFGLTIPVDEINTDLLL